LSVELGVQYASITIALFVLILKYKGMKPYIPVAMFASLYANLWCYIAAYFNWWEFPIRSVPIIEDISLTANMIVVPIIAMFWIRYCPMSRIKWAFLWTTLLTVPEYFLERHTNTIQYGNSYDWYHSYILWLISWFIWYQFHRWFYKDRSHTEGKT
jgi:hypothetical protein